MVRGFYYPRAYVTVPYGMAKYSYLVISIQAKVDESPNEDFGFLGEVCGPQKLPSVVPSDWGPGTQPVFFEIGIVRGPRGEHRVGPFAGKVSLLRSCLGVLPFPMTEGVVSGQRDIGYLQYHRED